MIEQRLYESIPDRLYKGSDGQTWYACYDSPFCILTNAGGDMKAFCYSSKSEYRDVRRSIVTDYGLREVKVDKYDEDYR